MHRHPDAARHPLRGAVACAGLLGGHVGVGHQVDVGPGDVAGVGGQHDRTVGLGQLRQPLGRERGVDQEPAGGDVEHLGTVADHDQCPHAGLEDAVQTFAQGPPGRDLTQRGHQLLASGVPPRGQSRGSASDRRSGEHQVAIQTRASDDSRHRRCRAAVEGGHAHHPIPGCDAGADSGTTAVVESVACGLGQSLLHSTDPPQLASEADLAAEHDLRQPTPGRTPRTPPRHTTRGRPRARSPARRRLPSRRRPARRWPDRPARCKHREQQRQPAAVETLGGTPRAGEAARG